MNDRPTIILACTGLAIGGIFGVAGTVAPTASLRGLAWGIDGVALVIASALLTVRFLRLEQDLVATGFLIFAIGQGCILSGAAVDNLAESIPSFGAGTALWAAALVLISLPRVFPVPVRLLGQTAAILFAITSVQIFTGAQATPISKPLPFFAYPVFVATFMGWIWTLLRAGAPESILSSETSPANPGH